MVWGTGLHQWRGEQWPLGIGINDFLLVSVALDVFVNVIKIPMMILHTLVFWNFSGQSLDL